MAKAQSDAKPPAQIKSRGKTHVTYNARKVGGEGEGEGNGEAWEYDYVEVVGKVTKAKVLKAMEAEELEDDLGEWTPDATATQYSDAKEKISLSGIAEMTYAELDMYINNNVTNLAEAKAYLKKLSKVVLAMLKKQD